MAKIPSERRRSNIQLELSITTNEVTTEDQTRRGLDRIRIEGGSEARHRGDRPATYVERDGKARVDVKPLDYRRRDDRLAVDFGSEEIYVVNCLFPANAF